MPIDFDASHDAAAAPRAQLQGIFDAPLRRAAQQLIDLGGVSDVRVLQNGRVVTGIAGDRQRVYIQYQRAGATAIEGECSCGEPSPCVHVAAVAMSVATISGAPVSDDRRTGVDLSTGRDPSAHPPESALQRGAPLRQSLCYLIEPDAVRGLRLSAWVTQTLAGSGHVQSEASPFALRSPDGVKNYPRYVDARDRGVLDALTARRVDWDLTGAAGFDLLQRALATGRAFWRSLRAKALRDGGAREVLFAWQVLPNGNQRLSCETPGALDFLLELEPAVYIDTVSGNCGPLELPYPVDLLRQHWNRPAIDPAQVSLLNANLACEPRASGFPRLREMTVQDQALSSLRPRLVLSAGPTATLHFIYNGMAVDSESLRTEDPAVRRRDGDVVYQIARDHELERQLHTQLDRFLTCTARGGEAWLGFMINGVPALRALGWEITVHPEFPYRVAAADAIARMVRLAARRHGGWPCRQLAAGAGRLSAGRNETRDRGAARRAEPPHQRTPAGTPGGWTISTGATGTDSPHCRRAGGIVRSGWLERAPGVEPAGTSSRPAGATRARAECTRVALR
jgi:hypothetical protein